MNRVSQKRTEWLKSYKAMKNAYTPTECARCTLRGSGWKENGGDFEPHHIAKRSNRWSMCLFIALCGSCHSAVHEDENKAREEDWIINPKEHHWGGL